jgi:type I restriction enzyme S subunit
MSENWKTYKLGEISRIGDGAHAKVNRVDHGILYLTSKNFKQGKLNLDKIDYISENDYNRLFSSASKAVNKLEAGDIILGIIGTLGNAYLYKDSDKFGISSSVAIIRPDSSKIFSKYLYYYITGSEFKHNQNAHNGASVQGYTNIPSLKVIPISFPQLTEQCSIASILSAIDDKIELNLQMNKTLEEMAMALYKHWFVDFGPFQDGEFVDSELGMIPKGWEVLPFSKVTSKITDGAHLSPKSVDIGMPMASVKDMNSWGFNLETCRQISEKDYQILINQGCRPLKNDVVIAKDGSYLKHSFIVEKDLDIVLLSSIAILRPNGTLDPQLLNLNLKLDSVKDRMQSIVSGAAIQRIVLKEFRNFLTIVPPIEIQKEVIESIAGLTSKCWNNNSENQTLTSLRDTLLPKLISGEVRVKEAAEILEEVL